MRKILIVGLIAIFSFISIAGQVSSKEKIITDNLKGYSFTLPANWSSQQSEDSFVLSDSLEKANIVIKPHNYASYDDFIKSEGGFEKDGFKQVGDTRDFKSEGKFLRLYKQLTDKNLIADTFFVRSDEARGGVILVSFSTDNETADENYKIAYKIADGMRFSTAAATSSQTVQPSTGQSSSVKNLFAGKKLSYFYTGNGYTENATIWLCGSGRFFSKNESSSSSSLGSGFTQGSDQGSWDIITNGGNVFLVIKSDKGGAWNLAVTARQASNEISLNGKRFFVQAHNDCN